MENNKEKSLSEQLKDHIQEVGEEAFERECFEFNCKWYGIDPNEKNAKKKLRRKTNWEHFKAIKCPRIEAVLDLIGIIAWAHLLGYSRASDNLWIIGFSSVFIVFFGWKVWKRMFKY